MKAPVKLELGALVRLVGLVGALTGVVGCSGSAGRTAPASTTELRAAELPAPDAPRVGKTQREDVDAEAEPVPAKADPVRRDDRPAGGFSGYK
jgi:hypothetical protein